MKFFDPKTDVLDIEVTPYGRHLLSTGKFRPSYYAFYDDDVLYDSAYANVLTESQNQIQTRIKTDTPRLRTQGAYAGVETNVKKANKLVRGKKVKITDPRVQPTPEKHFALSAPLGNSGLDTQHAPAWRIKYLKGTITGSLDYTTGSYSTLRIPQLTSSVAFKAYLEEKAVPDSIEQRINFEDDTSIRIEDDMIVLETNEDNTSFLTENFDIEVFKVEVEKDVPIYQKKKEELIPLSFVKKKNEINSSLLLEEELDEAIPDVDPSFVEYFLDIEVDSEIDRKLLCKLRQKETTENIFTNDPLDCDELDDRTNPEDIFSKKAEKFKGCK